MTPDVRSKMEQAKNLIKAKRYDEARLILQKIDNPTAHRWLEKLDEIEMFGAPISASRVIPEPPQQAPMRRPSYAAQQLLQNTTVYFFSMTGK